MTLPLWCGPAFEPGGDGRLAQRYLSLMATADSGDDSFTRSDADEPLLTRLRSGDDEAFDQLYRAHIVRLLDFAERYVSADVADDVVHAVLAAVWERRRTLAVRRSFAAYLFGAVRREILQRQRHLRVVRQAEDEDDVRTGIVGDPPAAPDASATLDELRAALREALDGLPSRTRDVLTLRWVEELHYDEIAEVLGISVSAAKMHVHRAQPAVRFLLERFRDA